jgi:hypothetical protein
MPFTYEDAVRYHEEAVHRIFASDPRVQSVGIGRAPDGGCCFRAVRNLGQALPAGAALRTVTEVASIPVLYADAFRPVQPSMLLPFSALGSSLIAEQRTERPLLCGLQIQPFDHDKHIGNIANGMVTLGTLGCFVRAATGHVALLSNRHVIAPTTACHKGDRIVQAACINPTPTHEVVARLEAVHPLKPSPAGAHPMTTGVVYNEVDAALALLDHGIRYAQQFLPDHNHPLPSLRDIDQPRLEEKVFKVGRTTGLTWGTIKSIGEVVGPLPYDIGSCWFRRSFIIEGVDGTLFSDKGDSGSVIVRPSGEVLGLLYSGNDRQTYACPIHEVFSAFGCKLA